MIEPLITGLIFKSQRDYHKIGAHGVIYDQYISPWEVVAIRCNTALFPWLTSLECSFRIVNGITEFRISHHGLAFSQQSMGHRCNPILINFTTLSISTSRDRDALEYFLESMLLGMVVF